MHQSSNMFNVKKVSIYILLIIIFIMCLAKSRLMEKRSPTESKLLIERRNFFPGVTLLKSPTEPGKSYDIEMNFTDIGHLVKDLSISTENKTVGIGLTTLVYDIVTTILTGLGIVPIGLVEQGLQFTILLASFKEIAATYWQIHNNMGYNLVNMFDRILLGYFEPENLKKLSSVQSLPGTLLPVTKVTDDVVKIGYHLVDTRKYITLPLHRAIIYLNTFREPK